MEQSKEYEDYKPQVEIYTIPRVIGIKQAAQEFGIAEYSIRRWIKEGQLPVIRCGRSFLINCTVFANFLNGTCQPAPEQLKTVAIDNTGKFYTTDIKHKGKIKPIY